MSLFPIYRLVLPSRTRRQLFVHMSVCPTCTNDVYFNVRSTRAHNSKVWVKPHAERTFHRLKSLRDLEDFRPEGHPVSCQSAGFTTMYHDVCMSYGSAITGIIQTAVWDRVHGPDWVPSRYTCHLCREPKFARPRLLGRGYAQTDPKFRRKNALYWVYLPEFTVEKHPVHTVFMGPRP